MNLLNACRVVIGMGFWKLDKNFIVKKLDNENFVKYFDNNSIVKKQPVNHNDRTNQKPRWANSRQG